MKARSGTMGIDVGLSPSVCHNSCMALGKSLTMSQPQPPHPVRWGVDGSARSLACHLGGACECSASQRNRAPNHARDTPSICSIYTQMSGLFLEKKKEPSLLKFQATFEKSKSKSWRHLSG